ncbi:aldolase/citrate lyase family protein [Roseomonas sp. GC11]|uniref:HpcH/HpaI aldolase family protein n=1 Tax=Roseomonas sp. GC11 TaxID=2950546 RepID=UPI0021092C06|nr:aldolase/citrate lyase family protein [Roseomonas sp. GC11]MCQ4159501.1 aldolase/citrate lyase family protein [Roseomonas sp. GC11]
MSLREHLERGEAAYGLAACLLRTAELVPLTRACGFDFLLVDTEHTPLTIGDAATLCVTAQAAGLPALVRVGGPEHPDLARVLDIGAQGVVVAHVDSAAQAARIVRLCRFAPAGGRSLPSPLARFGFRMPPAAEMARVVEAETLLVPMIESAAGVAEAEAIAATPGIDALLVGTNDLAADLGHFGAPEHPAVLAAFARIAAAARAHGKAFGVIGLPPALLESHAVALGATLVVVANDVNLLLDGGSAALRQVRGAWGGAAPA